jgi:hypothetical protein
LLKYPETTNLTGHGICLSRPVHSERGNSCTNMVTTSLDMVYVSLDMIKVSLHMIMSPLIGKRLTVSSTDSHPGRTKSITKHDNSISKYGKTIPTCDTISPGYTKCLTKYGKMLSVESKWTP